MKKRKRKKRKSGKPTRSFAIWAGGILLVSLGLIAFFIFGIKAKTVHDNYTLYRPLISRAARRHGLEPAFVLAVVKRESNFDPDVRGAAGEYGLMQVTRGAASDWERINHRLIRYDSDLFDPSLNVEIGTWYLARAWRQFNDHPDRMTLALSQYNAGPSRARKWSRQYKENLLEQIPISSTRHYITKVTGYYQDFLLED